MALRTCFGQRAGASKSDKNVRNAFCGFENENCRSPIDRAEWGLHVDLRQLEILRAVAQTGSFTSAGEQLHLSQSAVSRQILLLEEELKEQLFLRLGRRIQITPAGTTLLGLSERMFEDLERTRASILDKQQAVTGTVRLVGGMTVCLYVFPPLLKAFRKEHPGVEVKLTPGATPRLIRQLRTGTADLGLLTLPIDEPNLVSVPVMREELMLVTAPTHPLSKRKHVTPRDLIGQPFVLFEAGSNSRKAIEAFFVREQIAPKVVTETENVEIIKALVMVGMGIAIIPYQAVAREVRSGQLFCTRIAGQQLVRETGWVHLRLDRVPRAVQELMRTLERVRSKLKLSPGPPPKRKASEVEAAIEEAG
jgi:DNA-binding transcriptional LysR family regulator